MKSTHRSTPAYQPPPAPSAPSAGTISHLADLVLAGQIVEAALTDGTFVLLMAELQRRGLALQPRDERVKALAPFLFRVAAAGGQS
jgi:hypothetical protein